MLGNPEDLGQSDTVNPRSRVHKILHTRPFHSDGGMGSVETGFFMPRCFPAPKKEHDRSAGRIRTYGLPKRATRISSPLAAASSNCDCLRKDLRVTIFMSDNLSDKSRCKQTMPLIRRL